MKLQPSRILRFACGTALFSAAVFGLIGVSLNSAFFKRSGIILFVSAILIAVIPLLLLCGVLLKSKLHKVSNRDAPDVQGSDD